MNTTPLEFQEQRVFVNYLELLKNQGKVKIFTALPQNIYTKSWKQKRMQKIEGVRPGYPDLCVVTEDKVLFIEMKRKKGSRVSPHQKEWLKHLGGKKTEAVVCKGADEAIEFIDGLFT